MSLLKRLGEFYIFSNVHVALATSSLSLITMRYFGIVDELIPLFIFAATLLSYNFIRLYRRTELDTWFHDWVTRHHKLLWALTIGAFLTVAFLAAKLSREVVLMVLPLAVLTFFYSVPLLGQTNLRSLPSFKLFLISTVWASVTVLLPAIQYEIELSKDLVIIFIQRLLFVAAITLPFDLRDVKFDKNSLQTIPQVYGIQKTKKIGLVLLMFFIGLNFLKEESQPFISIEFFITLLSLGLLLRASNDQNPYYSAFFVESLPIIWWLGVLLVN